MITHKEKPGGKETVSSDETVPSSAGADNAAPQAGGIDQARPCPQAGVEAHSLLDEMVLYLPGQEMGVSLNSSARAIWELCDGRRSLVEISRELGRRLDCSNPEALAVLLADVKATVLHLGQLGLLAWEEASETESP